MDALSPTDRLKMEAARSIREDFLHQVAFDDVDTYTSLEKQLLMMKLVLAFYHVSLENMKKGASMNGLIRMAVRERIGRFKYTPADKVQSEYETILRELQTEADNLLQKEDY